jgi:hypothetical protein
MVNQTADEACPSRAVVFDIERKTSLATDEGARPDEHRDEGPMFRARSLNRATPPLFKRFLYGNSLQLPIAPRISLTTTPTTQLAVSFLHPSASKSK